MSNQNLIHAYELQLQPLKNQFDAVVDALNYADPAGTVQLELQRDRLAEKIGDIQKRIEKLRQADRNEAIQELIDLLRANYETTAPQIALAYQRTVRQKRSIAQQELNRPEAIVRDLISRVEDDPSYTWLQCFVGHLLAMELPLSILPDLKAWAEANIPELANLQARIAELANQETNQSCSCLLVRIRKSIQKSINQSDNRYFIHAWFVDDVAAYRMAQCEARQVWLTAEQPGQSVDEPVSPEQTYGRDEIEPTIRQLRQRCFDLYQAERPLIQVFLPLELMNLDIDRWALQEGRARRRFGTHHEVVLRAGDRLDLRQYDLKQEWQSKWQVVERRSSEMAREIFRDANPDNVDAIYGMGQLLEVLGIKLTQAVSVLPEEKVSELFEAMVLESAIPLAFWSRQSVDGVDCCSELSRVLTTCPLERLPGEVRHKRLEVLSCDEIMRDQHIGNHLSLLWDDPTLLPPTPDAA